MNESIDFSEVAARSLNLYERLPLLKTSLTAADGQERLKDWKQMCSSGDPVKFKKRLSQDGIKPHEATAVFNSCNLDQTGLEELPWLDFYKKTRALVSRLSPDEIFAEGHNSHAFFHLVYPFYSCAVTTVQNFMSRPDVLMTGVPIDGPCKYLKTLLTGCAAPTAQLEFRIFKTQHGTGLSTLIRQAINAEDATLYREFIQEIYDSKWDNLFAEYAVLTRQLCRIAENWSDALCTFFARYQADLPGLEQKFNKGQRLGNISKINWGLSDRHNGGQTTAIIDYISGVKLVYKPKPLGTEQVLSAIIDWINEEETLLGLKAVPVLEKKDYGWQQFVANKGCSNPDEIKRFYIRAGYLMALVYIMEGYDFHYENLIADGEYPYLIDTETIFNPYKEMEVAKNGKLNAAYMASENVYYSVLRTGMLPNWSIRKEGEKRDSSGFGGNPAENGMGNIRRWVNIGTDNIRLEQVKTPFLKMGNQPFIESQEPVSSENYIHEIISGFHQVYEFVRTNKTSFCALIRKWDHVVVRFVRKPTRMYADLLTRLTGPEYMRDGMDWSVGAESMARLYLAAGFEMPGHWNLLREEYRALMQADIPYFSVNADALGIKNGSHETLVASYFTTRCFERIIEKTSRLDPGDLALQERYIRYAYYAKQAKSFHQDAQTSTLKKINTAYLPEINAEECIRIATIIADELEAEALVAPDGSMAWIALEYLKEADIFQFKPVSYNLYSGATGIGFFFAALFSVTGQMKYHDLARAAMIPVMRIADEELNELMRYSGLGAGVGLGSLIYGFAAIADFMRDTEFGNTAENYALKCAGRIDIQILQTDQKYDLIFGSSGLLLGLYKLYQLTKNEQVLESIVITADYLLKQCKDTEQGNSLIPTYGNVVISGISHGASGVALAFLKAFELTRDPRYKSAAMAHLEFEEKLYDQDAANYPTYKSTPDQKFYITSWCHGAPGIGLVRLSAFRITGDEALIEQIDKNLAVTSAFSLEHLDHLCCGNFGRLDIELEHATFFKDENLLGSIRRDARYIVDRFHENDSFRVFIDAPTKVFSPGLFVGATGIAYSLLRIAYPDKFPCILTYE